MRTLPTGFNAQTTSLCWCIRLIRRDGMSLGTTDHDRDLAFDGVNYRADAALGSGALNRSDGLPADQGQLGGALSHDGITEVDIAAGRWDGAEVALFRVNWAIPSEHIRVWTGRLGTITRRGAVFDAEVIGLEAQLETTIGRVYSRLCDARLGDARCGIDLAASGRSALATVTSSASGRVFTISGIPIAASLLATGTLVVATGPAEGLTATIASASAGASETEIVLGTGLHAPLAPGDTVTLSVGCDRRFATCVSRFGNGAAFRGFPHMPGDDVVVGSAGSGGLADGGRRA